MISPLAYVDPSAKLGENVKVHPFAYIDANVEIGDNCEIMPYASIMHGTRMGNDCKVYQGAIVGADPQDFRWKGTDTFCYIGNEVVIREHVIINRGIYSQGGTRIGDKCFIMAEAHIGHDTQVVGKNVIGNGATIAGDAVIGEGSILSSNAIVNEKVHMGRYALLKGGTRVSSNVPPFVIIAHNPATYYGINAIVMRKGGDFTEEEIDIAAKAYRHVYQCATTVFNALKRIEADIEPCPVRDEIINFIRENNLKIVADKFFED
ncbi:MAG: acyl-ACP--UDP-N-acetylglucosamine O-acyltransferase [Muribaculaceae bacterium]|nr:acyl-ACP--UDP-N-acetylglucosamine O-acyltransferase [Muribaculaceae bacterium]MDE6704265.1 acyl-ACP--UDP-N-acetylglucosamine O-acyltransferase [Muribaculaceae bacterium]